jgi:ketosteroid isomerase-like protein
MTHNADVIRNTYDAFARGDIETVVAVLDPKVEWTEAAGFPTAGTYTGPEAVVAGVFVRLGTEWENFEAVPDRITADGGTVVATGTYSGIFKETGRSFTARFAHVWEMRDGKVVGFEQVADTAKVQEALA